MTDRDTCREPGDAEDPRDAAEDAALPTEEAPEDTQSFSAGLREPAPAQPQAPEMPQAMPQVALPVSARQLREINAVRTLVRWIVGHQVHGVTTQSELAGLLRYSQPELSRFMPGKKKGSPLPLFELVKLKKSLVSNLGRLRRGIPQLAIGRV